MKATTRRAKRYSTTEVNRLLEQHRAEIADLKLANANLRRQLAAQADRNEGLLQQLADAEDHLLQIEADTARLGPAVRAYVEDTERNDTARRTVHPSVGGFSAGESEGSRPRPLRLVQTDKGEQ